MTVKDPAAVLEPAIGAAKTARRDAVGAEIPVTVHASRTTQGLGKNLPAVHEDTKTVIVLQQGAVVRLTANLSTGETVVLTNRMTGADVLCRAGKIKSQPGIQHYVDLEFMQRAPNFWGDALAAVAAPVAQAAPARHAPASAVISPAAFSPQSPAIPSVPVTPSTPMPAVLVPPTPIAPMPSRPAPVAAAPSSVSEPAGQPAPPPGGTIAPEPAPAVTLPQPDPVTPIHSRVNDPIFDAIGETTFESRRGSRTKLMVAAAVAALLLGGGAGGYWFYTQQMTSADALAAIPLSSIAPPPAVPDLTPVSAPAPDPIALDLTTNAAATETSPRVDVDFERTAAEPPAPRVQPAPAVAPRQPARPERPRTNVAIGQLKAPIAKAAAVRVEAGAAPPAIGGTVSLGASGVSALLASDPAGPAPPPTIGGRLQQPELITATAAVYPANARMQRIQGTVVLDALVDETGKVVETKVIAGPRPLLLAAQQAVRTWKYRPAQLNGKPIAVHTKVSVRFALQ